MKAADLAWDLLTKNHEFLPFAVTIHRDDAMFIVPGSTDNRTGEACLTFLYGVLQHDALRGQIKVAAVAAPVTIRHPNAESLVDAVRIEVEHEHDVPITTFLPFAFRGESLEQVTDSLSEITSPRIFLKPAGA